MIGRHYTKIELNELLSKEKQQVNDNSRSLINYVSNKNKSTIKKIK